MLPTYWVYILSSRSGVLYVGQTNDLERRLIEHREGVGSKFCGKYNAHKLVYTEAYSTRWEAMARERQLKRWRRTWKEDLIRKENPNFEDLWPM
jgi:putative endonuclease